MHSIESKAFEASEIFASAFYRIQSFCQQYDTESLVLEVKQLKFNRGCKTKKKQKKKQKTKNKKKKKTTKNKQTNKQKTNNGIDRVKPVPIE